MEFIKLAKFISANHDPRESVPKFRKEFSLSKKIRSAVLEISALGVYEAELNGKRVGDFILAPGWTEYDRRVQYQSYDVTDLVSEHNTLTVGVGRGWYGSRVGFSGKYPLGEHPALIAALILDYADGERELILTDESWLTAKSETLFSDIYDGEITDGRIIPEYTESARIYPFGTDILVATEGEYVREIERISPKRIFTAPNGELLVDFGQNLTGYAEFRLNGKAGDKIRVSCAEILDRHGNFYNANYRTAKSLMEYTLRDGEQTYKPRYTFFGFRYLRIEGIESAPRTEDVTAIVLHSDMKRTGYFTTGHKKLSKLYENVIWGQRGNFLDVPTDCPQRDERLGWTGDAQVFCRTAMLNYDCRKFFKKWLKDLALAQYPDGAIPRVVPNAILEDVNGSVKDLKRRHSAAWGDAATVCPWEYYMAYGDVDFLKECFPVMKAWVGYIEAYSEDYIWSIGFHFGDWLALDVKEGCKGGTDYTLIATAFFYHSTELVIKAGKILGEDVSHYEEILPKIKEAFNRTFIKNGSLTSDTQTAQVLAIHFGLVDGAERTKIGQRLIELIEERGDTLTTGFVGTPYLLDALTEIGRVDKAYTLLLQEKFPSWLFSVNMGATTIWEHWDGINENGDVWSDKMNSFNHYAYGAVAAWLYRTVCGIRYDESCPAYKRFFIEPIPCEKLGSTAATLKTENGDIHSEWVYEDGRIRYSFTIPPNTVATVTVGEESETLSAGTYTKYTDI